MKKKIVLIVCCFLSLIAIAFACVGCVKLDKFDEISKNLMNYDMDIVYDEEEQMLYVEQIVDYVNNTECVLGNAMFHLYANAFKKGSILQTVGTGDKDLAYPNGISYGKIDILDVKVNNKECDYELCGVDENILNVMFKIKLQKTAMHKIYIRYCVKIPNINHRFGFGDSCVNLAQFYPVACVFENGKFRTDAYHVNGDPFYSEMANYEVKIQYDENFKIAASGNEETSFKSGINITKISAKAIRDFAIVLSENFKIASKNYNDVSIRYFYYEDKNFSNNMQLCVDAIKTYCNLFGNYPYDTIDIVKTNFLYGGMEYSNLVLISDDIGELSEYQHVIAHELAHQWWYGVVGNNAIDNSWLDEGLTEYSTMLFYENNPQYQISFSDKIKGALENYNLYIKVYSEVFSELDTSMNRTIYDFKTQPEYVFSAYVKSMLMHNAIRNLVGYDNYIKSLKLYFNNNQFKIAEPQDLYDSFDEVCKRDISQIFVSWVNGEVILNPKVV